MDGKVPPLYKMLSSIDKVSSKVKQTHCNNTPKPFPLHLRDDFKVKGEGRLSVLFSWEGVEASLRTFSLESAGQREIVEWFKWEGTLQAPLVQLY